MRLKLSSIIKTIIYIIVVIILISAVCINNNLKETIDNQMTTINTLSQENTNLNLSIIDTKEQNDRLHAENKELKQESQDLLIKIESLEDVILQLQENISELSKKDFKSYLPYTAITNKTSKQWELQQIATTNDDGIRCINGIPMVAVGTGWGVWVGDMIVVTCANGNSFTAIIGDIKDDKHTDAENKTTVANGCRCEFLVDKDKLDPVVRSSGNIATMDKYKGYVINIVKVD